MTPARLAPAARRDLLEAMQWIARDSPQAAKALRHSFDRAARVIGEHPESGTRRPDFVNLPYRVFSLTGFPYTIIYNADRRPPLIVRVLHGARDMPEVLQSL